MMELLGQLNKKKTKKTGKFKIENENENYNQNENESNSDSNGNSKIDIIANHIGHLLNALNNGKITGPVAKKLLSDMIDSDWKMNLLDQSIDSSNLFLNSSGSVIDSKLSESIVMIVNNDINNDSLLREYAENLLRENRIRVERAMADKRNLDFLMGPIIKFTGGKYEPRIIKTFLENQIKNGEMK